MADWEFTTSDNLAAQRWANRWWIESKTDSFFYDKGFIGPNEENSIIAEFPDLEKEQGYQLTFGQIRGLSGAGVTGDNEMEGNEEVPDVYDDAITLDQVRNAVRSKGKLSEQYPSDKAVKKWAVEVLKRWKSAKIDQDIFTGLGASLTKVLYGGDATTTATIEAGDYMTCALIARAVAYAKKATPKIVGPSMGGKRSWVCVMSPDQSYDLTERDGAWSQPRREALPRSEDNPIFKDRLGYHKNTVLHEHERVALATTWGSGTNLNGATALFLGVGAGGIAYVKKKIWNEKTFDYGNKVGFCIGAIWGFTKAVFNSADHAVVGIRTYRTNN